jgi:hypothetical protein
MTVILKYLGNLLESENTCGKSKVSQGLSFKSREAPLANITITLSGGFILVLTKKLFYAEQHCSPPNVTPRKTSKDSLNLQLKRESMCGKP